MAVLAYTVNNLKDCQVKLNLLFTLMIGDATATAQKVRMIIARDIML